MVEPNWSQVLNESLHDFISLPQLGIIQLSDEFFTVFAEWLDNIPMSYCVIKELMGVLVSIDKADLLTLAFSQFSTASPTKFTAVWSKFEE